MADFLDAHPPDPSMYLALAELDDRDGFMTADDVSVTQYTSRIRDSNYW